MTGVFDEYAKRELIKNLTAERDVAVTKLCSGHAKDISDYRYYVGVLDAVNGAIQIIRDTFIIINNGSDEDESEEV